LSAPTKAAAVAALTDGFTLLIEQTLRLFSLTIRMLAEALLKLAMCVASFPFYFFVLPIYTPYGLGFPYIGAFCAGVTPHLWADSGQYM